MRYRQTEKKKHHNERERMTHTQTAKVKEKRIEESKGGVSKKDAAPEREK